MFEVTLPVVSAILPIPPVMIEVTAHNWHQATRLATQYAQKVEHVAAPVVAITAHEAQAAILAEAKAAFLAKFRHETTGLNGTQECWWKRSGAMVVPSNILDAIQH